MGKVTWHGWRDSPADAPVPVSFITGGNLRRREAEDPPPAGEGPAGAPDGPPTGPETPARRARKRHRRKGRQ
jgi:hypothetical protein